jgi:hypothetical protein
MCERIDERNREKIVNDAHYQIAVIITVDHLTHKY